MKIKEIIEKEIEALRNIPIDISLEDAVERIFYAVHQKKGKVIISGMGKAGHIGYNIAMTMSSTGTPAVFLHPSEAQHGDLGILQKNDILIVLSNSGKTREIIELLDLAKGLNPEIKSIAITGDKESEVARKSDTIISTGHQREICPLELTPTASTTAMTVIGDILVILLMEEIKFSKGDYALRHHSGYLGKKARGEES